MPPSAQGLQDELGWYLKSIEFIGTSVTVDKLPPNLAGQTADK
jgi:hypothetical protein